MTVLLHNIAEHQRKIQAGTGCQSRFRFDRHVAESSGATVTASYRLFVQFQGIYHCRSEPWQFDVKIGCHLYQKRAAAGLNFEKGILQEASRSQDAKVAVQNCTLSSQWPEPEAHTRPSQGPLRNTTKSPSESAKAVFKSLTRGLSGLRAHFRHRLG